MVDEGVFEGCSLKEGFRDEIKARVWLWKIGGWRVLDSWVRMFF